MEENNEIVQEQLQQTHPDFVKMMEAFALIRQNIKDYKQKLEENGQNRDLTEEETTKIIASIVNGKGMKPNNPFLKDGEVEEKDMTNSVQEYIKHCRTSKNPETGISPHYNIDGYQDFMQKKADDKDAKPEEKEKALAIASKVGNAKEEFQKTYEEQYYKTIFDILENTDGATSMPDPSKYYWACEQLKQAEELKYQIIEDKGKQQVSFAVKFKGQPEKVFKSIDFKQQRNEIAPSSARDFSDLNKLDAYYNGSKSGNTSYVESKPKLMDAVNPMAPTVRPPIKVEDKNALDKYTRMNNDPSSRFYDIKQKLGFNMNDVATQDWIASTGKREIVMQILFSLRDTKGITKENVQELTQDAE